MTAAQRDSPTFRVSDSMSGDKGYIRLEVEGYGGMNCASWLDRRPLTVAGARGDARRCRGAPGPSRTALLTIPASPSISSGCEQRPLLITFSGTCSLRQ